MKNNFIIFFCTSLFVLISCKKETDNTPNNTFKKDKELIENLVKIIVKPNISNFTYEVQQLQKLTNNYTNTISISNLEKIQQQWKVVSKKYAAIFAFNIGELKNKYMRLRLYNWPSTNNAIENNISNKEITEATIKNFGSSTKGIAAIEYLLFSENTTQVHSKMSNDKKRRDYLILITNELLENAKLQQNLWSEYGNYLVENNKTSIDGSFNLIFNGINNVVHYANETKIGKPAGLLKSKHINTHILQAFFSGTSLDLIQKNLETVENVFFNENIVSISDKIEFVTKNKKLNNTIKTQFTSIFNAIKAIKTPLKDAVYNKKEQVKILYEELKKLEVLFTVDVRSTLSLIITGTDGDGD